MHSTVQLTLRRLKTDATLLANNSAKKFDGFKLCTTTRNNIQQHATGCTDGRNM